MAIDDFNIHVQASLCTYGMVFAEWLLSSGLWLIGWIVTELLLAVVFAYGGGSVVDSESYIDSPNVDIHSRIATAESRRAISFLIRLSQQCKHSRSLSESRLLMPSIDVCPAVRATYGKL